MVGENLQYESGEPDCSVYCRMLRTCISNLWYMDHDKQVVQNHSIS